MAIKFELEVEIDESGNPEFLRFISPPPRETSICLTTDEDGDWWTYGHDDFGDIYHITCVDIGEIPSLIKRISPKP